MTTDKLPTTAILITKQFEPVTSSQVYDMCSKLLPYTDRRVTSFFFYFDTVNIIQETSCFSLWNELKSSLNVRLIACSTLAKHRGIDESDTGPFELAGLSEFYTQLHQCDELVQL